MKLITLRSVAFYFFLCLAVSSGRDGGIVKTVVVDQSGHGDFRTVQSAIDSVPSGNRDWIKIFIKIGVYNEMVVIPRDKQRIVMEGEDQWKTIIQYNGVGTNRPTFRLSAEYFVGVGITFKNTYNKLLLVGDKIMQVAPAALIESDKVAFLRCGFISLQDTLADARGRHLFQHCYIEGAVDFIWGFAQSMYQGCEINVSGELGRTVGFITAQGRETEKDTSGFVFVQCNIFGNTKAFLGRAYRQYSRVVFYKTTMSDIIVPLGWDAWTFNGREGTITYAEVECGGAGANMEGRVKWEKTLSPQQIDFLTNPHTFIDQDGWIQNLPFPISFS
ncbi:PREDICTED: probable pectinesterase 29 [Tarenaya hassleriana]|uniref:probable pectinesterase 29 n=1 Tax=Tarenaya hassleriana TaxID=28532 RepID=UPI00053C4D95|nr:PREDICTED: probable pectinesterase 29 [Tarenaya hassleriana]